MRIAAIEPYAALSHVQFLEGLQRHSRHEIEILSQPARAWKWRMRTSALHFAPLLEAEGPWDLLFVSDYLNLGELRALLPPSLAHLPAVAYFHENQLTYPLQPGERRDHHFALIHLYTCLSSARVLFNSDFHRTSFLDALVDLLQYAPDIDGPSMAEAIRTRSDVVPLGIDTEAGTPRQANGETPIVLWNHRWEYDKAPETFVSALRHLDRAGSEFRVRVLGQSFRRKPEAFTELQRELGERVEHVGFVEDPEDYARAVAGAHIAMSTARHEFFGLGTLEAIRAGLYPVLPNRLAYPELLPSELRADGRFLYDGGEDEGHEREAAASALQRAVEAVAAGTSTEARQALVAGTERFLWPQIAPRFDAIFEAAASSEIRA